MKTARRRERKAKSGFPGRFRCLRQPEILALRSRHKNATSVVALPFERMLVMLRERCLGESQSAIAYLCFLQPDLCKLWQWIISVLLRVSVAELGAEPVKNGALFILPCPSNLSQQP